MPGTYRAGRTGKHCIGDALRVAGSDAAQKGWTVPGLILPRGDGAAVKRHQPVLGASCWGRFYFSSTA